MQVGEQRRGTVRETLAGNMDTSFLKLLALVFMLVDHVGVTLYPGVQELRIVGRMAFPLYAWCLVVGSVKTRSPLRYGLRLLGIALISQPLYMMALSHQWTDGNILFTLLLAVFAIWGIRARRLGSELWAPALCYLLLGFCKVDYGWRGLTFILVLYAARENRAGLAAAFVAYALYWGASSYAVTTVLGYPLRFLQWPGIGTVLAAFFRMQGMVWLALPLILIPTHTGIRLPKWLGYGLYPLHLIVLIALRLTHGVTWAMLLQGF